MLALFTLCPWLVSSGITCVTLTYLTCPRPGRIVACPSTSSATAIDAFIRSTASDSAPLAARAGLHRVGDVDAHARHRRDHGGVHRGERRAVASAALRARGPVGGSLAYAGGFGYRARRPIGCDVSRVSRREPCLYGRRGLRGEVGERGSLDGIGPRYRGSRAGSGGRDDRGCVSGARRRT